MKYEVHVYIGGWLFTRACRTFESAAQCAKESSLAMAAHAIVTNDGAAAQEWHNGVLLNSFA
jgi:hypothetical protein